MTRDRIQIQVLIVILLVTDSTFSVSNLPEDQVGKANVIIGPNSLFERPPELEIRAENHICLTKVVLGMISHGRG